MDSTSPTSSTSDLPSRISKAEINALPLIRYKGKVSIIETDEQARQACRTLQSEAILGFDTESRPSFRAGEVHPVALIQLASADHAYLFQILKLNDFAPLVSLLENPSQIKAGVALHDDIKRLQESFAFTPAGFCELSTIARERGIENTGLRSLSAICLKARVSKGAQVSNWARSSLTDAQIRYAATDAWVSRKLYLCLTESSDT